LCIIRRDVTILVSTLVDTFCDDKSDDCNKWMIAGGKSAAVVQDTTGQLRVDKCRPE